MRCRKCGEYKEPESFSWYKKSAKIRQSWCKKCMTAYIWDREEANREFLFSYLREHPCAHCGEADLDVLEFDHIEPMGRGDRKVWGWARGSRKRLIEEIARCQVLCSNCHTRKTRKQMGYRPRTRVDYDGSAPSS